MTFHTLDIHFSTELRASCVLDSFYCSQFVPPLGGVLPHSRDTMQLIYTLYVLIATRHNKGIYSGTAWNLKNYD